MIFYDSKITKEQKKAHGKSFRSLLEEGVFGQVDYCAFIVKGKGRDGWLVYESEEEYMEHRRNFHEYAYQGFKLLVNYERENVGSRIPFNLLDPYDVWFETYGFSGLARWIRSETNGLTEAGYADALSSKPSFYTWGQVTNDMPEGGAFVALIQNFLHEKLFREYMRWAETKNLYPSISEDLIELWINYQTAKFVKSSVTFYNFKENRQYE